jgi:hypothetical protein
LKNTAPSSSDNHTRTRQLTFREDPTIHITPPAETIQQSATVGNSSFETTQPETVGNRWDTTTQPPETTQQPETAGNSLVKTTQSYTSDTSPERTRELQNTKNSEKEKKVIQAVKKKKKKSNHLRP